MSASASKYAAERAAAVSAVGMTSTLSRKLQENFDEALVVIKDDASPVTVADFAVQALIVSRLHEQFPEDNFIAEEFVLDLRKDMALFRAVCDATGMDEEALVKIIDLCDFTGADDSRTWILDPNDGTRGFVKMRHYCIALGLMEGGVMRVGVLGCPNLPVSGIVADGGSELGSVFHAEQGQGAYMISEKDIDTSSVDPSVVLKGKRCNVSDVTDPSKADFCESFEARHSSHSLSTKIAEILNMNGAPYRLDSQAKYGCIARGDVSIFLRFPREGYVEKVYDSAPAVIVVEEAGGRVTDGRGQPLDFSKGRYMDNDDGIVATNGVMHDTIIEAVQAAIKQKAAV